MQQIPKEWLTFLREQFPQGSRIKLREMGNDPCPIEPGTMGTLEGIDDAGHFLVNWDNGRGLNLVLGEDSFSVLPPPLQTLKLYMPITVSYYDDDGYQEEEITLNSRESTEYAPQIIAALQKEQDHLSQHSDSPEEAERGLMAYYGEEDSVEQKVRSCHFTAEVRDGQFWGVAECKVQGQLTPEELSKLMESVSGDASDGFGEIFEQHEIRVDGGLELYAHLWQSEGWTIMTEQDRFDPHFSERLPDLCWSTLPDNSALIYIKRGETGYYTSKDSSEKPEINRHMADYQNRCRGISPAQEEAMLNGCLHGWDSPAADPRYYAQRHQPEEGSVSENTIAEGLPELCFSTLTETGALICIQRGESGYSISDWSSDSPEQNRSLADHLNQQRGITPAQEQAMSFGSMFGWNNLGADPKTYEQGPGTPTEAQQSGSGGERSRSEMEELSPQTEASDMELAATMGGMNLG